MLELAQNLILNEDVLNSLSEKKRSAFVYEWLCFLSKVLGAAGKDDIRDCQLQIVEQIFRLIQQESKPPIRTLIGQNLAKLFDIADQAPLLIKTFNRCLNSLKSNNEIAQLNTVVIIGALYERLGRFLHRSCEETVQVLLILLKNGDSQMRCEVLLTLEHITNELDSAGRLLHREIHKTAKNHLCDRAMPVRSAAAMCLIALINQNNFMYTSELHGNVLIALRAFENSNSEVRCSVAKYLAILLVSEQNQNSMNKSNTDDTLRYLSEGFLRGNQSKGSTTVSNEIRIRITYTYVELFRALGTTWIEQHLSLLINHLLEIADSPRLCASHIDALFSRKCITFILRSMINLHLNENAQFLVAKELIVIIKRSMKASAILTNDSNLSPLNSSMDSVIRSYGSTTTNQFESTDIECRQNLLVSALDELNFLIQRLGTATCSCNDLAETLFLVILSPSQPVRLTAAWCFRSIATVLPSLITPLIDQCLEKMNDSDVMLGHASVLQALLGAVHQCPLGIPSQRVKKIFDFANHLLRTTIASTVGQEQSSIPRLILPRISTAWNCLSACCTLDQSLLRKFIPRLIVLWRNVFPRSPADFERERQRGDSLTWILSLNQRSGALRSISSFLSNDSISGENILSNDLLRQIVNPITNAIAILFHTSNLIRQFGLQLQIPVRTFRWRLFELLLLVPSQLYERYFKNLSRELMNEFTLVNSSFHTTTSLLKSICHDNGHDLLDNWSQEVGEQLHSHFGTSLGALEYDETCLYRPDTSCNDTDMNYSRPTDLNIPEPLPLNIVVIDASIRLFSRIFAQISNKHRLQIFQHFIDLLKQSKDGRQEAIQINILTVIVLSLKTLSETTEISSFGDDNLNKCACALVIPTLNHPNVKIRCVAAEAFSRLIQVLPDKRLTGNIIRFCFDQLKESRDIPSRTGYSLALACSYRYLDDRTKEQYFTLSIPVLCAMVEDQSTTVAQVWVLHALTLIVNSSGPLLWNSIEALLEFIVHILLSASLPSQMGISRFCGRLLGALVVNMGPDLQANTEFSSSLRSLCMTAMNLLQMHIEPAVQAEAIQTWQQLYVCAPRHVNLSMLVPQLIQGLTSEELLLRRACISCLKQISQGGAKDIHKHAKGSLSEFRSLEELLFSILDTETDIKIYFDIQDVLVHMLQTSERDHWLQLCHDILAATTATEKLNADHQSSQSSSITEHNSTSSMKWQTKVFAIRCLQKLINYCESRTQFNLLTKSSFLACISTDDPLRLSGLSLLKQIILQFTHHEQDIDSSNHSILTQYVSEAIRSAFSTRTPSHVTIQACDVCRIWIFNNISLDPHQLLASSLQKLTSIQRTSENKMNMIYNESIVTSESLAILSLWSDIYNFAVVQVNSNLLVLNLLIHHWLAALTDYAFLMLPKEFHRMKPLDGNFYSHESDIYLIRRIYRETWSSIMRAATRWLVEHHFELEISPTNDKLIDYRQGDRLTTVNKTRRFPEKKEDLFSMLLACCIDALSISISEQTDETIERILVSLITLLQSDLAMCQITMEISTELINVLHRFGSVRTDIKTHLEILKILKLIFHLSSLCTTPTQSVIDESFLFTSLTFLVSILLNYFPNINNDSQLYSIPPIKVDCNNKKDLQLVELITEIIPLIQQLISATNQNIQKFVPVFLHLLLSLSFILLSTQFDHQKSLLSELSLSIDNLFRTPINKTIAHGATNTIMNLRANLLENNLSDNGYFVRCLTSLILNADSISLTKQMIDFYHKAFNDQNVIHPFEIHFQIFQCLDQLIRSKNLSLRKKFIRAFTPVLLTGLKQTDDQQRIIEILKILEKLLSLVDPLSRLRLASLVIPFFTYFLPDSTSLHTELHERLSSYVIERLHYLHNAFPSND